MQAKIKFECGPDSTGQRYWISLLGAESSGEIVASGVKEEYALLIVHAVNELYKDEECETQQD